MPSSHLLTTLDFFVYLCLIFACRHVLAKQTKVDILTKTSLNHKYSKNGAMCNGRIASFIAQQNFVPNPNACFHFLSDLFTHMKEA